MFRGFHLPILSFSAMINHHLFLLTAEVPHVVKNSGSLFNINVPEQWLCSRIPFTGFVKGTGNVHLQ